MMPSVSLSERGGWITIEARSLCRSLYVGGNWNNGTNAGVSYVNANNDLSNSNNNIGSRLNFKTITVIPTLALARTTKKNRSIGTTVGKIGRTNEGHWVAS